MTLTKVDWRAEYAENGRPVFRVGVRDHEVVAEWIDLAILTAARNGQSSSLVFAADATPEDRKKIERGSAMLLLRHLRGELALHGAAVARDGQALVILGRSGQGKSTLAAAFCSAGWSLLADDAVALERGASGWSVLPSEDDHWLDARARAACGGSSDDGHAEKWPQRAPRVAEHGAKLSAIVELVESPDAAVTVTRTNGIAALASVVPQSVRFLLDDTARNARELDVLVELVEAVPTYILGRRRDYGLLPAAVRALEGVLRGTDV